jgi:hypothetical protein
VWDGEPFVPMQTERHRDYLAEEVSALRFILAINDRARFEFVVTPASIREVDNRGEPRYAIWVRDVLDRWLVQSDGEDPMCIGREKDPNVSGKDWLLLRDALAYRCDAFLTSDGVLFDQAHHVERRLGIRLLRPITYAALFAPWANLYR